MFVTAYFLCVIGLRELLLCVSVLHSFHTVHYHALFFRYVHGVMRAGTSCCVGQIEHPLTHHSPWFDRIEERLRQIEKRLDLVDA